MILEIALSREVRAALAPRFPQATPSSPSGHAQVAAQAWGYAELMATSVQADSGEGLTQGIIGLVNKGQSRRLDDGGALRAWAWATSRLLDYFEKDKAVDPEHAGVEGWSRYGKRRWSRWPTTHDWRSALSNLPGASGAKTLRRNFGEHIENLASTSAYHRFEGNFLNYAGARVEPTIFHWMPRISLRSAPRDRYSSRRLAAARNEDGSTQMVLSLPQPARFIDRSAVKAWAPQNSLQTKPRCDGDIFRQHRGGHTTGPNWPAFLTIASRCMKTGSDQRPQEVTQNLCVLAIFSLANDRVTDLL